MMGNAYELRQVSKVYDGRPVVDIGSLDIRAGEVLAIVGPSGAGKSTMLRMLNFLEPPTAGTLTYGGVAYGPTDRVPLSVRRQVTTVFQSPLLLNRSVSANARYGLRIRGEMDGREAVDAALTRVGLSGMARRSARRLSGGEGQRVALARALVVRPKVLLLDEPTANLDPYNVGLIEEIVLSDNDSRGTTVVWVTHNVMQAKRVADRVALLLDGRVIEVADPATFFDGPSDARVAAFVGGEMVY